MSETIHLREPADCTEEELRGFARLVLQGFPGAQGLDRRIRDARQLAFTCSAPGRLAAVAALKVPSEAHRNGIFRQAAAPVSPAGYELDLGWVFVLPAHRGRRIAARLCRRLLASAPSARVFATTRTDNRVMRHILRSLGFRRTGRPYPRRDEELLLLLRPPHALMKASNRE